MSDWIKEKVLILVKTYPVPSASYSELVCVAGITEEGKWRRLYPIPFRDLPHYQQFKKYSWVDVEVTRPDNDQRLESRSPNIDSIELADCIDTSDEWRKRREWVERLDVLTVNQLQERYEVNRTSLGVVVPTKVHDIKIEGIDSEWSEDDLRKLSQMSLGGQVANELKKIPKFSYVFECDDDKQTRHAMVTDWEPGMRYIKALKSNPDPRMAAEEVKNFYLKLMDRSKYDTRWFMGTVHPYNTWIVVGLFYPPKLQQAALTVLF